MPVLDVRKIKIEEKSIKKCVEEKRQNEVLGCFRFSEEETYNKRMHKLLQIYKQIRQQKMSGLKKSSRAEQKQEKYIQEPIQTVDGAVVIKKYIQIKSVGSGSYSKCYLVKNKDSDSTYVAKVIPKKKLEILQKQKLVYEIKIHQSLSHPNVVHLDHWFEDENNQYIFMEYCPNGNLETKLAQSDGNMPESQIRRYGSQIVQAIAYIHSQNILHRDLKLCNFYLDVNCNVKLGDFGFACQLASEFDKKRETCGTPNYIAPEAISGFGYSFSSDVWAIGVILYRLKYGCCPFQGQTVKQTLENVKLRRFSFPSKPKISPELKDVIQKIFNLNYDERLSTEQILNQKFFEEEQKRTPRNERQLKEQKRGFSFTRLFSLDKTKASQKKQVKQKQKKPEPQKTPLQQKSRQGIMQRQSRNPGASTQKKEQPKRSNSCETFKQIKQIFKNKSKQNLATSGSIQAKKQTIVSPYYTLNTVTCTTRERELMSNKTNRASIMEYSYSIGLNQTIDSNNEKGGNNTKRQQNSRSNKVNQFMKTNMTLKQHLKMNKLNSSKNSINASTNVSSNANIEPTKQNEPDLLNSNSSFLTKANSKLNNPLANNYVNGIQKIMKAPSQVQQQLFNYSRKFYLPMSIQQEKDVIIIHFKPSVKQIIYANTAYIMHRTPYGLYKMTGEQVNISDMPKVFKYVIENKVQIVDYDNEDDYNYSDNDINRILQLVPTSWISVKDGIIFKYGTYSQVIVAKLFAQEGFYISDQNLQSFMYNVDNDQNLKLLEGVVVMRIYSGWVKTNCKK